MYFKTEGRTGIVTEAGGRHTEDGLYFFPRMVGAGLWRIFPFDETTHPPGRAVPRKAVEQANNGEKPPSSLPFTPSQLRRIFLFSDNA